MPPLEKSAELDNGSGSSFETGIIVEHLVFSQFLEIWLPQDRIWMARRHTLKLLDTTTFERRNAVEEAGDARDLTWPKFSSLAPAAASDLKR